ncbi:tail fiber domain-containing protein [Bacillus paranthracis]|uniref:tail fiber domain-containing protein n=1 Tax=Bacillus paranthracis TaxID=2026186 RepID=UPI0035560509
MARPRLIRYLENGEYKYASIKDAGNLAMLKTLAKDDLVSAINWLYDNGGASGVPTDVQAELDKLERENQELNAQLGTAQTAINNVTTRTATLETSEATLKQSLDKSLIDIQTQKDKQNQLAIDLQDKLDSSTYQTQYEQIILNLKDKADQSAFDGVQGRVTTVEQSVTSIQGEVSTKMSQTDFDGAVGLNKWVASKYPISGTDLNQTPPSFELIRGMQASSIVDINDDINLSIPSGDHQITHFFTNVNMRNPKTFSLNIAHKGGLAVFVNGASVYSSKYNGTGTSPVSISLRAGWNTIEILHGQETGTPVLNIGAKMSAQVDKLTSVIGIGNKNDTRLTKMDTELKQTTEAISIKADKSDVTSLGNRVSSTEAQLTVQGEQISSKVSQQTFDAYSKRVGDAESSIIQLSNKIESKVGQTDFDNLNGRVSTTETSITQLNNSISAKANQTDVDKLTGRVSTAETSITANTTAIGLKASQSSLDTLTGRVTNAEASITTQSNQIALKVGQADLNALSAMNVLHNTEWQTDTAKWSLGTGWVRDTSIKLQSAFSMKQIQSGQATDNSYALQSEKVNCVAGDIFTGSVYAYSDNITAFSGGKCTMELDFYDNTNAKISITVCDITPKTNGSWQRYTVTGTAPANTAYVILRFHVVRNGRLWVARPMLQAGSFASIFTKHVDELAVDLITRISNNETSITQTNQAISLKADATNVYTKAESDGKVSTAVTDAKAEIKITTDAISNTVSGVSSTVDGLGKTVASQATQIKQTQDDISLNVVKKDNVITSFNASQEGIKMKAEKIDLIGAVTINALDDSTKALVNNALSSTVTYNGVKIDASNGLVVTKSDNKVKTKINATDGIKIQKSSDGVNFTDVFWTDTAGVIHANGLVIDSSSTLNGTSASTVVANANNGNTANNTITSNKSTWDRSTNINADGTFNTGKLNGTIADSQIASATAWNSAKVNVDDILSDLKVSPVEKIEMSRDWENIKAEYTQISAQATILKVDATAFTNAYNAFDGVTPKIVAEVLATMNTSYTFATTTARDSFKTKFITYYSEKEKLRKALTDAVNNTATSAQSVANTANSTANTVNTTVSNNQSVWGRAGNINADGTINTAKLNGTIADTQIAGVGATKITGTLADNQIASANNWNTAKNSVNDMVSDLKITPLEKNQLSREWESIKAEYVQLSAQATALSVSATSYTTSYNNLDGVTPKVATDILASMTTTYDFGSTTNRDNFKTKMITYFTESEKLRKAISDAINSTANTANSNASSAVSTANTANSTANTANSTASTANTNASTALSTANTAKSTADSASSTASTASTNASQAVSTANTANSTANTALTNANSAQSSINDIMSDLKVTPVEKNQLLRDWQAIQAEYTQLSAQASSLGVSNTSYVSAYTALDGTSPKINAEILVNMSTTYTFASTTTRDTFKTKINTYYTETEKLRKAVNDKIQSNATSAQSTADTANSTANTVNGTVSNNKATWDKASNFNTDGTLNTAKLNGTVSDSQIASANTWNSANTMVTDMSNDNKLTSSEKQSLKREFDQIVNEKTQADSLSSTYGLTSDASYTSYVASYNTLYNYVNPLLSSLTATSSITGSTMRSYFADYYDKASKFGNVVNTKAKALADGAQNTANSATELAQAMANGKMLNADPVFRDSNNGTSVYNNGTAGVVTLTRVANPSDSPTTSPYCMEIKTTATGASPANGGFTFSTPSRANATFIIRIIAKLPVGTTINWASNSTGTGSATKWLTPNAGTGTWTEYVYKVVCGATGTFSSTNYFYSQGGTLPLTWNVAYATVFDMSEMDYSINDMLSDLKVTPLEKNQLSRDWEAIKAEYAQLSAMGTSLGVSVTSYTTAYNNLDSTSPKIATEILASLTTTYTFASTTARDSFKNQLTTYYSEAEKLRKAISDAINSTANTANTTANTANGKADTANTTINNNKATWDRASNINSNGTFNSTKLSGAILDSQISSATNWNGAKSLLDTWKSGTFINGQMIGTNTIFAQQIAIGDFTNLSQINEEKNPNGYPTVLLNNKRYFKIGNGAYAPMTVMANTYVEFLVNDEYYIAFNGYRDTGLTTLNAIFRYYYSDGTWENAGSVSVLPTTADTRIAKNLKITVAPNDTKTLTAVNLFFEKDGTAGSGYYYVRDIEVRKRYTGSLIVDGSIKASQIDVANLFADSGFITNLKTQKFSADQILGGTIKGSRFESVNATDSSIKVVIENNTVKSYGALDATTKAQNYSELKEGGVAVYQVAESGSPFGDKKAYLEPARFNATQGSSYSSALEPTELRFWVPNMLGKLTYDVAGEGEGYGLILESVGGVRFRTTGNSPAFQFDNKEAVVFDKYGNIKGGSYSTSGATWSIKDGDGQTRFITGIGKGSQQTTEINAFGGGLAFNHNGVRSGAIFRRGNDAFFQLGTDSAIQWNSYDWRIEFKTPDGSGWRNIAANSYANGSSLTYKTEIKNYEETVLDQIMRTDIMTYRYKSDVEERGKDAPIHLGVISEYAPQIITTSDGTSVDLYAMISVAWKAIQELSEQVRYLNEKLKNR